VCSHFIVGTSKLGPFYLLAVAITLGQPAVSSLATVVKAQVPNQRESFEVASIRENHSSSIASPQIRQQPSGLTATNVTVLSLIQYAFGVTEGDIVAELPSWVKATRFDVVAKTAHGPLSRSRLLSMTKVLLEDRFGLDASYERVEGPVYALVTARADGKTGPRMRPSESNCLVDAPLDAAEQPVRVLNISSRCGLSHMTDSGGLVGLFGSRVTLPQFARELSRVGGLDRPVVDRTGLKGEFDMAAAPTPDMVAATGQARFLIALREQLGLVLRSEPGSFEVLKIRRIEKPSPN
jgi:uncharacterized protein (TIGR03435 family)